MATLKGIGAVFAGFVAVVILSTATDFALEASGFFPPQSEPGAYTAGLLCIAFFYRSVYTVAGGYVTARLAPLAPMRHAIILGIVGIIAGTLGAVVTWEMTPHHWYPISLVVFALPCTWLGGRLNSTKNQNTAVA